MPGIWNVNSSYNVNNKRISTKLSFEVGEKFSARILDLKESTGEILLKLLDGWQFSAEIENPGQSLQNKLDKLVRLEVQGFEDGKLKLKIVNSQDEEQGGIKDSIDSFIKESADLNLSSDDYQLIKSMLEHEIPLTKNNISNIKTTLDFINKIKDNNDKENKFIGKYLESRNISIGSKEGKFATSTLKNFFNQLKEISSNDLFTFLENNMELSEDNIKSFNNVFKKDGTIYNEIKLLGKTLSAQESTNIQTSSQIEGTKDDLKGILEKPQTEIHENGNNVNKVIDGFNKENIDLIQNKGETINKTGAEKTAIENNIVLGSEELDASRSNEALDKIKNTMVKEKNNSSNIDQSFDVKQENFSKSIEHQVDVDKDISPKNIEQKVSTDKRISSQDTGNLEEKDISPKNIEQKVSTDKRVSSQDTENLEEKDTSASNMVLKFHEKDNNKVQNFHHNNFVKENSVNDIVSQIKDQISIKTDEMKNVIKTILDQRSDGKNQFNENIVQVLNNSMNDFKVFNTISNSYYYMDLPINLNQQDYQCKLMIKDERKKGKKIDSTNVKIATSISTENMGIIDAYLSVKNRNMDVDIKCSKEWINLFKKTEKNVLESLSDIGYNVYVRFSEKKDEMNISTCREFFQDSDIGIIDTKA